MQPLIVYMPFSHLSMLSVYDFTYRGTLLHLSSQTLQAATPLPPSHMAHISANSCPRIHNIEKLKAEMQGRCHYKHVFICGKPSDQENLELCSKPQTPSRKTQGLLWTDACHSHAGSWEVDALQLCTHAAELLRTVS